MNLYYNKRQFAAMAVMLMFYVGALAQKNSYNLSSIAQHEKRGYEQRLDPPGGFTLASNNFKVYYYCFRWNINPAVRYISGSVTSYFTMTAAGNQLVYDLDNSL